MLSLTSRAEVESHSQSTHFHFKRKTSPIRALLYRATKPAQRVFCPALLAPIVSNSGLRKHIGVFPDLSDLYKVLNEKWLTNIAHSNFL